MDNIDLFLIHLLLTDSQGQPAIIHGPGVSNTDAANIAAEIGNKELPFFQHCSFEMYAAMTG